MKLSIRYFNDAKEILLHRDKFSDSVKVTIGTSSYLSTMRDLEDLLLQYGYSTEIKDRILGRLYNLSDIAFEAGTGRILVPITITTKRRNLCES